MRKYDLSKIMKRACELVKKAGVTISGGLKKSMEGGQGNRHERNRKTGCICKEPDRKV